MNISLHSTRTVPIPCRVHRQAIVQPRGVWQAAGPASSTRTRNSEPACSAHHDSCVADLEFGSAIVNIFAAQDISTPSHTPAASRCSTCSATLRTRHSRCGTVISSEAAAESPVPVGPVNNAVAGGLHDTADLLLIGREKGVRLSHAAPALQPACATCVIVCIICAQDGLMSSVLKLPGASPPVGTR